ncbi:S8 family peptidase [Chryseobacterium sp.]|uniref:S8 family peptidase n=1 Tax=Chryseobacterium sp. TaxID=1871047 RepID=UPI0025C16357|nr:S8 family peptidase [Chryseobacterium sp.]
MKRQLFLIGVLAISLANAQDNEALKREFEKQNRENNEKFDSYLAKRLSGTTSKDSGLQNEIIDNRENLAGFTPDGKPYYYQEHDIRQVYNSNADAITTAGNITGLNNAYNGEGIKFTIFDGGRVYAAHPAFANAAGRITNKEASSLAYSGHSTGVAGFIGSTTVNITGTLNGVATTANIQGIAKNSTINSYSFSTTTLPGNSYTSSVFQKILTAQPAISNHSYGIASGWTTTKLSSGASIWLWTGGFSSPNTAYDLRGTYFTNDQNYDQIVYNNPSYIIVKSAGNSFGDGPTGNESAAYTSSNGNLTLFSSTDTKPPVDCAQGYDCIGIGSLAKNIIVVGASDVITNNNYRYTSSSDAVHSFYSSAGPRDDGGIKPDITTTGTNVFYASSAENTTGSSTYAYGNGTSFSAPVVTGIIGLWTQIYKDLFSNQTLNAASAKTLTIHSALEAGNVGPDPLFGWGLINAKRGAEILVGKANNTVIFDTETLTSGTPNEKIVKASGSEPLKVTISWTDPEYKLPANMTWIQAYNNRTSRLVNDLDLRIIDTTTNTTYYPWKLNATNPLTPATKADNTVDNVEQVVINTPVAGREYRVVISNKGTLVNNAGSSAPQNYSIIVTGQSQTLGTTSKMDNEASILDNLAIVPTITKDFVKVLRAPQNSTFSIYDLSGKKLQSGKLDTSETSLNLSSYTQGIYIVEIKTGNETITRKVIKE